MSAATLDPATLPIIPINPVTAATVIRDYRTAHSLSQQDLVDQLLALAHRYLPHPVGLDRQMVSKWERGLKRPSPLYRRLLGILLATPVSTPAPDPRAHTVGHNARVYPHRFGTLRPLAGAR